MRVIANVERLLRLVAYAGFGRIAELHHKHMNGRNGRIASVALGEQSEGIFKDSYAKSMTGCLWPIVTAQAKFASAQ